MSTLLRRSLTGALVTAALSGGLLGAASPAQALEPNRSCGTVTDGDGAVAAQLNGVLTGNLRNAMTAYRVSCARSIVAASTARGLPERAAVIAVTTSIVESTLHNNPNQIDHDSVGLFQQRATWGTLEQRLNPAWSTNAFLAAMERAYPNGSWQNEQIGVVCQTVQVSAYPDRYQPQSADAQRIVSAVRSRPLFEAASDRGWGKMAVSGTSGQVSGSAVAAIEHGGAKLVYTVRDGAVYEASSANAWENQPTGIVGVSGSAVAAISVGGVKYVYTIKGGQVHEASSANGWSNLPTGIHGANAAALAAISVNGTKLVYTLVGGVIHEASSAHSWANASTGVAGSTVAAIAADGVKTLYTLDNFQVYEASSANGWARQAVSGASGNVTGTAVAALSVGGVKLVYTVNGGTVYEASSANAWQNLSTWVTGSTVTPIVVNGVKTLYTL